MIRGVPFAGALQFFKRGDKMSDYEKAILDRQDNNFDECANCPHKGKCNNQCAEVVTVYNPNLQ